MRHCHMWLADIAVVCAWLLMLYVQPIALRMAMVLGQCHRLHSASACMTVCTGRYPASTITGLRSTSVCTAVVLWMAMDRGSGVVCGWRYRTATRRNLVICGDSRILFSCGDHSLGETPGPIPNPEAKA